FKLVHHGMVKVEVSDFITDFLFNDTAKWTDTHGFIVTFFDKVFFSCVTNNQINTFLSDSLADLIKHQVDNIFQIFLSQMREFDDTIETVKKFWAEVRSDTVHNLHIFFSVTS